MQLQYRRALTLAQHPPLLVPVRWVGVGSWPQDGPVLRAPDRSCCASQRTRAYPVPPWRRTDAGWRAAQSLPLLPDHDPVPPWPARADPRHARVASSETVAAHPEACREPPLSQFARRHITVPLRGCSTDNAQTPLPYAGSLPVSSVKRGPGTSSPHAPGWRRRAPAAGHCREATPPVPSAATPNSCCGQNGGPASPAPRRSPAPGPPQTALLPARRREWLHA